MRLLREMQDKEKFSKVEQDIIDYILKNRGRIADLSIRRLAEETYTSSAAIFRLCQKLGLKGYTEFKIKLISEISNMSEFGKLIGEKPITDKDSVISVVEKIAGLEREAVEETKCELKFERLMRISNWIEQAPVVHFFSFDNNVRLAQLAASNFMLLGKPCLVNSATNFQIAEALSAKADHVAILLSRSGENRKLLRIAGKLRENKTASVLLTPHLDSPLAKACNETLYVANTIGYTDLGYFIYSIGVNYLLNVLFSLMLARHYKNALYFDEQFLELMGREEDQWRFW